MKLSFVTLWISSLITGKKTYEKALKKDKYKSERKELKES